MRYISNILKHFPEFSVSQFPQQQSQKNREREAEQKAQDINRQCVSHNPSKIKTAEKAFEMFEADPLTSPYASRRTIVLKSYQNAVHGCIQEQDIPYDREQKHQIQFPACQNPFP